MANLRPFNIVKTLIIPEDDEDFDPHKITSVNDVPFDYDEDFDHCFYRPNTDNE